MALRQEAAALFEEWVEAQRRLSEYAEPLPAERAALLGAQQAVEAALDGAPAGLLVLEPAEQEWSMAAIMRHLIQHDAKLEEVQTAGFGHYVEHALEHAAALWRTRRRLDRRS